MSDLFEHMQLPKTPRKRDKDHLAFIATLPCVKCFVQLQVITREVHVAHVRFGEPERGKPPTGMGAKPSDQWTVPLCPTHHLGDQHDQNERAFWARLGVDIITLCKALHTASGDRDAAEQAFVREANRARRRPPDTPYRPLRPDSAEARKIQKQFLDHK